MGIKSSLYSEYKPLIRALDLPRYLAAALMGNPWGISQESYFIRVTVCIGWYWLVPIFSRKLERFKIPPDLSVGTQVTFMMPNVIKMSIIWINFIFINISRANKSSEARCLSAFFCDEYYSDSPLTICWWKIIIYLIRSEEVKSWFCKWNSPSYSQTFAEIALFLNFLFSRFSIFPF